MVEVDSLVPEGRLEAAVANPVVLMVAMLDKNRYIARARARREGAVK
jgi:hypothetical protein